MAVIIILIILSLLVPLIFNGLIMIVFGLPKSYKEIEEMVERLEIKSVSGSYLHGENGIIFKATPPMMIEMITLCRFCVKLHTGETALVLKFSKADKLIKKCYELAEDNEE